VLVPEQLDAVALSSALVSAGVAAIYTPKDYELTAIMDDICELAARHPLSPVFS